ncbi:uncharacterized protein V1510DRAFT_414120 [Dipodascopsis tothii]|uniref:uncharacterized protein n=1 Tax=Dipodascopsis tothii TaxID=44089 RepID=UPI0034D015A0
MPPSRAADLNARNRQSQRDSRSRRKEYVKTLEEKLRALEAQGIRATQDVQKAARYVAAENTLLRSLLALKGVKESEIVHFIETARSASISKASEQSSSPITTAASRTSTPSGDDGQYTSCIAAARIVAGMRNNFSIRDIQAEFGCEPESECMVKNTSIFDALDK